MDPNATGVCRLCQSISRLVESHIIPKFVIRWMKTTGTAYVRRVNAPNIRLQDGPKETLLCSKCEQLFSLREGYFASHVFKTMLAGATRVEYDERLAYFLVSILWRVLQRNLSAAQQAAYRVLSEIQGTEKEWRRFLLNPSQINPFGHLHIFVPDIAVQNPPGAPNFNLYCLRAMDATIFDCEARCYVFAKFSRFFIIAMITPYDEGSWQNTRIVNGTGTLQTPQSVKDLGFGGFLRHRSKIAYEIFDANLTSKQLSVIRNQVKKKLPTLKTSDLLRASVADQADAMRVLSNAGNIGGNEMCPCGSGIEFKKCHGQ
jgi:hypothetical protein